MAYLLALSAAALYGTADFLGGLAARRANTLAVVVTSQGCGLTLLLLSLPLLPEATPAARDLVWGGAADSSAASGWRCCIGRLRWGGWRSWLRRQPCAPC